MPFVAPDHWQTPLVWVYGTLRQGERNHPLLASRAEYRGSYSCPGRLYAIEDPEYAYPAAVLAAEGGVIWGELFYLPEGVRAQVYGDLDSLEEIALDLFQVVTVPSLAAVAYVAGPNLWPQLQAASRVVRQIPDGDWPRYRRQPPYPEP